MRCQRTAAGARMAPLKFLRMQDAISAKRSLPGPCHLKRMLNDIGYDSMHPKSGFLLTTRGLPAKSSAISIQSSSNPAFITGDPVAGE